MSLHQLRVMEAESRAIGVRLAKFEVQAVFLMHFPDVDTNGLTTDEPLSPAQSSLGTPTRSVGSAVDATGPG